VTQRRLASPVSNQDLDNRLRAENLASAELQRFPSVLGSTLSFGKNRTESKRLCRNLCGKPTAFRSGLKIRGCASMNMFRISRDTPAYYLTSVVKNRLPVFRTRVLADLACNAIDEARRSAGFFLLAYVVMPDHLHVIVASELKPSKVQQYINGILSRRLIDYLKTNKYELSLNKLRHQERARGYLYSVWDHHPNAKLLTTEELVIQKVNYLHQNPVRAGLVVCAEDYRWSSARCWRRLPLEDEPLLVDIDKISWRTAKRG
jgi:putative transposase